MVEFQAWPSTPRLYRDCTITEKIDGTNACVVVTDEGDVYAQSRKRLITPTDDNFGFARWVYDYAGSIRTVLGPGYHYGEWYGQGIQRGYGLTEKRFALFNVARWLPVEDELSEVPGLEIVPVVHQEVFSDRAVSDALQRLIEQGSWASPGFMRPEGVVVYHHAARQVFKVLIENDHLSKTEAIAA